MSQRDGMRVERALGRLGPLAILGSAFLLGGLLGAALVSMIAQPAAEALTAYLRDYLTAGQAGKVAVDFWPMLWEQGRFFVGVCVLGLTALGAAGIPVLFGARGFLFAFSVAGFCRAFGPAGWDRLCSSSACPPFSGDRSCFWRGPRAWRAPSACSGGRWGAGESRFPSGRSIGSVWPSGDWGCSCVLCWNFWPRPRCCRPQPGLCCELEPRRM